MEFASGNYGMLSPALDYGNDTTAPVVEATGKSTRQRRRRTSASPSNEASSIYYTLDGSTPTTARPSGSRTAPGRCRCRSRSPTTRRCKWIATDFKGNTSAVKSKTFMIETDKPTATLTGFTEGQVFTQGRPVPVSYSCADEAGGSGLASCVGTTAEPRHAAHRHAGHVHLHGDRDRQRRAT